MAEPGMQAAELRSVASQAQAASTSQERTPLHSCKVQAAERPAERQPPSQNLRKPAVGAITARTVWTPHSVLPAGHAGQLQCSRHAG